MVWICISKVHLPLTSFSLIPLRSTHTSLIFFYLVCRSALVIIIKYPFTNSSYCWQIILPFEVAYLKGLHIYHMQNAALKCGWLSSLIGTRLATPSPPTPLELLATPSVSYWLLPAVSYWLLPAVSYWLLPAGRLP